MTTHLLKLAGASLLVLALTACGPTETAAPASTEPAAPAAPPAPPPPDYAAIVATPERIQADKDRDATRKPAEVLAFSKILPGQTVFEIEAGGGYYTELLAKAVGPSGKVIMQSPKEFESFYKDALDARLKDNRLANVTVQQTRFGEMQAEDASVDVVTWFQGPHELYCKKACGDLPMGEPAAVFTNISRMLKPGGTFVIMDHAAPMGTPNTSGNDTHRIDPMLVKALATGAGFVLEEESTILANPADDYKKGVFDKAVQGKTDQFLLRYKKQG